jgi:hypothetical protein
VIHGAGKQLSRVANVTRYIATRVNNRVPAAAFESAQISVAVSSKPLDFRKEVRIIDPAVEEGNLVLASEGRFDEMPPQEYSSTKD